MLSEQPFQQSKQELEELRAVTGSVLTKFGHTEVRRPKNNVEKFLQLLGISFSYTARKLETKNNTQISWIINALTEYKGSGQHDAVCFV